MLFDDIIKMHQRSNYWVLHKVKMEVCLHRNYSFVAGEEERQTGKSICKIKCFKLAYRVPHMGQTLC